MAKTVIAKKSLKEIDKMKGLDFEVFIGELLTQHGYKTQNIKGSGDFGVDVIAEKGGTKYAVQVKRYQSNVSRTAISDAVAGKFHWDCEKAWVVTNSYFTSDAKLLATSTDCKLTDRDDLKRMMQDGSTFASIFEGAKPNKPKASQKTGRSIWATLLLIGLAALGFYVIRFIPQDSIQQLWQSTSSTVTKAIGSIGSSIGSKGLKESGSTDLSPATSAPATPVQSEPLQPIPAELPPGFAPTVPSGLRRIQAAQNLNMQNETPDNSSIILNSGDNLQATPTISQPVIPTTTLEATDGSSIIDLNPSGTTTELDPIELDPIETDTSTE